MRLLFLLLISLMAQAFPVVAMSHGNDKASTASLLPACQEPNALPSPHCGRVPTLVFGEGINGSRLLYVAFSQNGHIYLSVSRDNGQTFDSPRVVNSKPELIYDDGENRPKIVLKGNNEIFVSWTHKTEGRYAGDVRFARSLDGGETFEKPLTINSDRALISHRFDSMSMDAEGRLYLVWIDKRDQANAVANKQTYLGAALYYAVSEDSGASFSPDRKLVDNSCECCRIAVDRDQHGQVVALWRHVFAGNIRDHAIAILPPHETAAMSVVPRATHDEWMIEGCPHHGPDLSIDAKNNAHMAWFTQGKNQQGLLYGQYDFITQRSHTISIIERSAGASRPQVKALNGSIYVMWKQFDGKEMVLTIRQSKDGGKTWGAGQQLATTLNASDHPDWVVDKTSLYASWHTQSEGLRLFEVTK